MASRQRRNHRLEEVGSAASETAENMADGVGHALDTASSVHSSFSRMFEQNRQIFEDMMRATQEESLRFVNRRLERTSQSLEACMQCDGISDMMRVQQEWLLRLTEDYVTETQRFSNILRDVAVKTAGNQQRAISEAMPHVSPAGEGRREAA